MKESGDEDKHSTSSLGTVNMEMDMDTEREDEDDDRLEQTNEIEDEDKYSTPSWDFVCDSDFESLISDRDFTCEWEFVNDSQLEGKLKWKDVVILSIENGRENGKDPQAKGKRTGSTKRVVVVNHERDNLARNVSTKSQKPYRKYDDRNRYRGIFGSTARRKYPGGMDFIEAEPSRYKPCNYMSSARHMQRTVPVTQFDLDNPRFIPSHGSVVDFSSKFSLSKKKAWKYEQELQKLAANKIHSKNGFNYIPGISCYSYSQCSGNMVSMYVPIIGHLTFNTKSETPTNKTTKLKWPVDRLYCLADEHNTLGNAVHARNKSIDWNSAETQLMEIGVRLKPFLPVKHVNTITPSHPRLHGVLSSQPKVKNLKHAWIDSKSYEKCWAVDAVPTNAVNKVYLEVDLLRNCIVTEVSTAGRYPKYDYFPNEDWLSNRNITTYLGPKWKIVAENQIFQWVQKYELKYRIQGGRSWISLGMFTAAGNANPINEVIRPILDGEGVLARYLRFYPIHKKSMRASFNQNRKHIMCQESSQSIAMRVGVYGYPENASCDYSNKIDFPEYKRYVLCTNTKGQKLYTRNKRQVIKYYTCYRGLWCREKNYKHKKRVETRKQIMESLSDFELK